ncbi:hypothetical protein ACJX0J_039738, partial [Zea mays]
PQSLFILNRKVNDWARKHNMVLITTNAILENKTTLGHVMLMIQHIRYRSNKQLAQIFLHVDVQHFFSNIALL